MGEWLKFWLAKQVVELGLFVGIIVLIFAVLLAAEVKDWLCRRVSRLEAQHTQEDATEVSDG